MNRLEIVSLAFKVCGWDDLYLVEMDGDANAIGIWESNVAHIDKKPEIYGIFEQEGLFGYYKRTDKVEASTERYGNLTDCCATLIHKMMDEKLALYYEVIDSEEDE